MIYPNRNALVFLKYDAATGRENFYVVDLESGEERQLTDLRAGVADDELGRITDGKQIVFDRLWDNADIVLMDLAR